MQNSQKSCGPLRPLHQSMDSDIEMVSMSSSRPSSTSHMANAGLRANRDYAGEEDAAVAYTTNPMLSMSDASEEVRLSRCKAASARVSASHALVNRGPSTAFPPSPISKAQVETQARTRGQPRVQAQAAAAAALNGRNTFHNSSTLHSPQIPAPTYTRQAYVPRAQSCSLKLSSRTRSSDRSPASARSGSLRGSFSLTDRNRQSLDRLSAVSTMCINDGTNPRSSFSFSVHNSDSDDDSSDEL